MIAMTRCGLLQGIGERLRGSVPILRDRPFILSRHVVECLKLSEPYDILEPYIIGSYNITFIIVISCPTYNSNTRQHTTQYIVPRINRHNVGRMFGRTSTGASSIGTSSTGRSSTISRGKSAVSACWEATVNTFNKTFSRGSSKAQTPQAPAEVCTTVSSSVVHLTDHRPVTRQLRLAPATTQALTALRHQSPPSARPTGPIATSPRTLSPLQSLRLLAHLSGALKHRVPTRMGIAR